MLVAAFRAVTVARATYINNLEGLVDGGLGIEREAGVDLGRDTAGNDLENLLAKLDQETVEGVVNLLVEGAALLLAVSESSVNQLGVLGLLGGSQDQRGVGGGILGFVLVDSWRER